MKTIKESINLDNEIVESLEKRLVVELEERLELGTSCAKNYCTGYNA